MSEATKKDIELVTNGLEKFLSHIVETNNFNLEEFKNFMEPIFTQAGYRENKNLDEQTQVLIIHDMGVGDFLTETAAIREIRRLYPDAYITLVVCSRAFALAQECPYVDEIFVNANGYHPFYFLDGYKWNIKFIPQLLEKRFDVCFAFIHDGATPSLMYMSGAKMRVTHLFKNHEESFGGDRCNVPTLYSVRLATHLFPMFDYGVHMVDSKLSLVEGLLGAPVKNREMEIWYNAFDNAQAKSFTKNLSAPIYAVTLGGSNGGKHYPPQKYARLLELIAAEEPTATFLIIGGGNIDEQSAQVLKSSLDEKFIEKHILDLTNKITYRQSAAVLKNCDMYIGNDTGTMHVAAAVKCPVLTPNCHPADIPNHYIDGIITFSPYRVPSVTVQPAHALPECKNSPRILDRGCSVLNYPHCITQIEPETIFKGFHILKERISKNLIEPFYLW